MVYLDFSKAFHKVDHGILLHKLMAVGITGIIIIWLFHFLTGISHFVRLPGGISEDHPVLSGVPQGTVLGPLLFLIIISDTDKDVSKLVSFADDTRLYSGVRDFTKHIKGMCFLSYSKRLLEVLNLYSLQKRREIWHYLCVENN